MEHLFGLCNDSFTHIDILDILLLNYSSVVSYVELVWLKIKEKFALEIKLSNKFGISILNTILA